jgi:hypothetical protein
VSYQALTLEEAEIAFGAFKEKWGKKHPRNENSLIHLMRHYARSFI